MTLKFRMVYPCLPSSGISEVRCHTWFTWWQDGTQSLVNPRPTFYQQSYMLSIWVILATDTFAVEYTLVISYHECSVSVPPVRLKHILYGQEPCTCFILLHGQTHNSCTCFVSGISDDQADKVTCLLLWSFFFWHCKTVQSSSTLYSGWRHFKLIKIWSLLWEIPWEITQFYSTNWRSRFPGNLP